MTGFIDAIFVGGPKVLTDAKGEWRSSIRRQREFRPVAVTTRGIEGDKVTQPYHGGSESALCVHVADHYRYWQDRYAVTLEPGSMGENFILAGITEDAVCVGDKVRCGSVLAQVSGPRVPCANLARHVGRSDWVKLTIRENRTGFYMRVIEAGTVQAGAPWALEERFDEAATIPEINQCMYLAFDPNLASRMLRMEGLGTWWRQQAGEKLVSRESHWTSCLKDESTM